MMYPLQEKIGKPDLLIGRKKEFNQFEKWIALIPDMASKSRVILARRKSGKTSFVQRIFNNLWLANGSVIPFYYDIPDQKKWYPDFAIEYFCVFASQYISFLERDPRFIKYPLTPEAIKDYGHKNKMPSLYTTVDSLLSYQRMEHYGSMWGLAASAPHRFASQTETRFLVILDEFQNIASFIYPDKGFKDPPIDSMAGSFHSLSESKPYRCINFF